MMYCCQLFQCFHIWSTYGRRDQLLECVCVCGCSVYDMDSTECSSWHKNTGQSYSPAVVDAAVLFAECRPEAAGVSRLPESEMDRLTISHN